MFRIGKGALTKSAFIGADDVADIFLGTLFPQLRGFLTNRVFNNSSLSVAELSS